MLTQWLYSGSEVVVGTSIASYLWGTCKLTPLEGRRKGGGVTAWVGRELANRGRLRHGQLSSPWRSGRRFANFQRQRATAGP